MSDETLDYAPIMQGPVAALPEPKPAAVTQMPSVVDRLEALRAEVEGSVASLLASEGHAAALAATQMQQVLTHIMQALHLKNGLDAVLKAI